MGIGVGSSRATKKCIKKDCNNIQETKGLCKSHYQKQYRDTTDGVNGGNIPKLSTQQCVDIRRMNARFKTPREIALKFGVSIDLVKKVIKKDYKPYDA